MKLDLDNNDLNIDEFIKNGEKKDKNDKKSDEG